MKNVLITDDEELFIYSIQEGFKTYENQLKLYTAENGKKAVEILESTPIDLLVTDIKMPEMDGIELIAFMCEKFPYIPIIAMSAFATPNINKKIFDMGAIRFLDKPIAFKGLVDCIFDVINQTTPDIALNGISVESFIQLIEMENKTSFLEVRSEGKTGFLSFNEGKLYNAKWDEMEGEEAAIEIISWEKSKFDFKQIYQKKIKKNVFRDNFVILMEAAKVKDERKESQSKEKIGLKPKEDRQIKPKTNKKATLKPENLTASQQNKATVKSEDDQENQLLIHAIKNAEEYKLQTAKNLLTKLLKKNQKNIIGWIWFSRVVTDLKIIKTSLKNAHRINPKNTELIWEIDHLKLFTKDNPNSKNCRRCPFCWCLVSINSKECISCNSILDPVAFFEKNVNISDISVLEKKVTMLKKIIEKNEKNKMVLYFLYLALSNLNKWDEGLHYLVKAVTYYPDNVYFSTQLNLTVKKLSLQKSKEKIAAKYKKCIRKTILVVEDSPTTRMIITSTLKKSGYNVVEAGDGLEALNKLNSTFPDMIILDIILPKMDGYQFLSIVKKNSAFKDLPVIMLTAKKKFIDKVKGKVAGSDVYLTKPFKPEKLKGLVESIIT